MIAPPDSAAPRDADLPRPKRLMSAGFWAMMAFCVLCLIAAGAVVVIAPRLNVAGHGSPVAPLAPTGPSALGSRDKGR